MKVSVIIPAYNVELYIAACLDSILQQTEKPFEVIVVVDGGSDRTLEIARSYEASTGGVVKVHYKNNGGLCSARNLALGLVAGDYIVFVDSDDLLHPAFIKSHLFAITNTDADISMGSVISFNSSGESEYYLNKVLPWGKRVLNYPETVQLLQYVPVWGKMFRSRLLEGVKFIDGAIHEDNHFSPITLAKSKRVVLEKMAIYKYRTRDSGSVSIMQSLNYKSYTSLLNVIETTLKELLTLDMANMRFISILIHGQLNTIAKYYVALKGSRMRVLVDAVNAYGRALLFSSRLFVPMATGVLRFVVFRVKGLWQ